MPDSRCRKFRATRSLCSRDRPSPVIVRTVALAGIRSPSAKDDEQVSDGSTCAKTSTATARPARMSPSGSSATIVPLAGTLAGNRAWVVTSPVPRSSARARATWSRKFMPNPLLPFCAGAGARQTACGALFGAPRVGPEFSSGRPEALLRRTPGSRVSFHPVPIVRSTP